MDDPAPENIRGEKRVAHTVNWQINLGHVVIGVATIYVVWKAAGWIDTGDSATGSASIEIEDDQEEGTATFGGVPAG